MSCRELEAQFRGRYPGCSILDFERTTLDQRPLGRGYFYNYPVLNKILNYDKNWRRPDGLGTEVLHANVNLSLVDAQIVSSLFESLLHINYKMWLTVFRLFFTVGAS